MMEIRKHLELNDDKKTILQDRQDAVKARLRREFIASNACISKESLKINDLNILLKKLLKKTQPTENKMVEIMKM